MSSQSCTCTAGNVKSDYLWICDPIDGTTNFTHSYPPFAVSVGVLEKGIPVAAAVVEFAGMLKSHACLYSIATLHWGPLQQCTQTL